MKDKFEIELTQFPSTRYQGSKRKLLPWIYNALKDIEFNTVLDAFGGTASVSYLFKLMGKSVTYNDFLKFNYLIGRSLIENPQFVLNDTDIKTIISTNKLADGYISKNFNEIYYLKEENLWLDNTINVLENLDFGTPEETIYKKTIAFNALFQSCLIKRPFNLFHRNNLSIRTANVSRSFGNKTTWEREFEHYFKKFSYEINNSIFTLGIDCFATNEDVLRIANVEYDLVYFDPPYVSRNSKNESADYLKCYHFLEGISNYKHWNDYIDFNSRTLNINNSYLPNHFKVSLIEKTFEDMIQKFRNSKIVISYKYGGIPSIDFIIDLLNKYNKKVTSHSLPYKYALNKQNGNAILNREFLIVGI